jgi:hypothetical protein
MSWEVWPWGRWEFRGRCTDKKGEKPFEAEIVAVTDDDVSGVLLRAPTKDEGMVGASRNTLCCHLFCLRELSPLFALSNTSAEILALVTLSSHSGN